MTEWIVDIMTSLGYVGIALLMFLENLFPPIPSELIMPLAGFTIAQGKMQFTPAVLAGILGTVLGTLPWYFLGKFVGEDRLRLWADRYGKWLTLSANDIDKADRWFKQHGLKAVFFCRLVPGIRTLISLPAGLNNMNLVQFLIYSTLGTSLWIILLTVAGYKLGTHYDLVDRYLGPVSKIVVISLAIWFGLWILKKNMQKSS